MAACKTVHSGMFQKGNRANPNGRPRGKSWTDLLRKMADEAPDGKPDKEIILDKLIQLAKQGEAWAIKEVLERMDGKTVQKIESDVTVEAINAKVLFAGHSEPILDAETVEPNELPETTD